ncbi:MAG TPA: molybdopterin-dependent oxidoreductase [Solirubrobacteraceae bacterium]|nr:molybdopterin-dependent oxidoreductase [Solirubrobacteraceae bacterium]
MTPRGTDWGLALLVAVGAATGLGTWFAGAPASAWVFAAHAAAGIGLAMLLGWKLCRVWPRVALSSASALVLVLAALGSGFLWASGVRLGVAGYNLLNWHVVVGGVLAAAVGAHAALRARPLRARDLRSRRQFLTAGALAGGALGAWALQRPVQRALGLRGASRRFTGSYDAGSFSGNAFPTTSWLADAPRPLQPGPYRLEVTGLVRRELALRLADLERGDELTATLDCTGGFVSTQRWRGVRVGHLLDEAGPAAGAAHVRVISRTGYRWSFSITDARALVLATRVGGEPLEHGHGAPCRLVAPDRRGFQWVKWVARIEVHADPDPGAVASTLWSSFTAQGRGASARA